MFGVHHSLDEYIALVRTFTPEEQRKEFCNMRNIIILFLLSIFVGVPSLIWILSWFQPK
ncbi:MAG: hypothetical protein ACD_58C00070G0002 [uncultured bacterium]|nr:MAG: hypothetical protein ACD_58C00070G0002 [uncultured bacterium]